MGLLAYASLNGVPLSSGPILTITAATIAMTELGQFSQHSLTCAAADERVITSMSPYTLLELVQDDLANIAPGDTGTIGWGYILNPSQQITDRDEHTVTFDLYPLTVEATWRRTRRGWTAANLLSVVAQRLGALVPGWTGTFTDIGVWGANGLPLDLMVSVGPLNNPTVQAAFLQTAQQFSQFARQATDLYGAPTRGFEMGQFGAVPATTLVSANGGDADGMRDNGTVRLVATVDRQPNDVSSLSNVVTPFGGGSGETLVTLERLWSIVNDPTYIDYGRWGSDAQSIAATGLPSLFPEYNPLYPISDPLNPPTGAIQWYVTPPGASVPEPLPAGWAVAIGPRRADGTVPLDVYDSPGHILRGAAATVQQGAYNTRAITVDGHFDYDVYDAASYALYGRKEGELVDSALTYADNSVANQELTERALYLETVTNFLRYAHPHHSFTCTTPGLSRPTRAGDLIAVDYQRVSVGEDGVAVVEMDVQEPGLRVMSVARQFQGDAVPVDTYTLSNLGRYDDVAQAAIDTASSQRQMIALQMNRGTGISKDTYNQSGNIDAANPITVWHYIVPEHFRYHTVRVRCDWFPFRGTATTATNIAGTPVISADVEVSLATPADINATTAPIPTIPPHTHQLPIDGSTGTAAPTGLSAWVEAFKSGGVIHLAAHTNLFGFMRTNGPIENVDLSVTTHTHPVAKAKDIIAHITAGQRIANLPAHVHDVEKRIPTGQPSPASIALDINGLLLSSGVQASGTRNADGSFGSAFVVANIGPMLDGYAPGTDVPLTFTAGTSASNPFGVGFLSITITSVEELGGNVSTIVAA